MWMCCFKLNCLAKALGQIGHLNFLIGPACDSSELLALEDEPALEPSLSIVFWKSIEVSVIAGESVTDCEAEAELELDIVVDADSAYVV